MPEDLTVRGLHFNARVQKIRTGKRLCMQAYDSTGSMLRTEQRKREHAAVPKRHLNMALRAIAHHCATRDNIPVRRVPCTRVWLVCSR